MRYAVFGVGRQGTAVVWDLIERCGATRVIAFDIDPRVMQRVHDALGSRAAAVEFHPLSPAREADAPRIVERIGRCAVVIGALPYALNPALTRLCLQARVPLCDLGGNPDVVAEQRRMADGSTLVSPDCGLAPGLNNILAVYLLRTHGVDSARAFCGGLPARRDPANPLDYKLLFSAAGLISEYSGRCAVLRGGRVEFVEALTGREDLPGDREAFFTSNNSPLTFEGLAAEGLRDYEYRTVRWRGHLEKALLLKHLGFFRGDRELDAALAAGLERQESLRFDRRRDVDEVFLRVEGRTAAGAVHALEMTVRGNESFTAMEQTTAWGITIPALWITAGARSAGATVPAGCAPPERWVDPGWALEELRRRTPVRQT